MLSLGLDELGIDPGLVGSAGARTTVEDAALRPPRAEGEIVHDSGEGGVRLAEFLASRKFI